MFGWAVYESALAQVPASEAATTEVSVHVTDVSVATVDVGGLDMTSGADRVALVDNVKNAACEDVDGECTVMLNDARRRDRRQLQAQQVELTVSRTYDYAQSPGAATPIADRISAGVITTDATATVGSVALTALTAETNVVVQNSPDGSTTDDAFADGTEMNSQLALRLPSLAVTVTTPVVLAPPPPPQPPPPQPLPPSPSPPSPTPPPAVDGSDVVGSISTSSSNDMTMLGIAIMVAALLIFASVVVVVRFLRARDARWATSTTKIAPNPMTPPRTPTASFDNARHSRTMMLPPDDEEATSQPPHMDDAHGAVSKQPSLHFENSDLRGNASPPAAPLQLQQQAERTASGRWSVESYASEVPQASPRCTRAEAPYQAAAVEKAPLQHLMTDDAMGAASRATSAAPAQPQQQVQPSSQVRVADPRASAREAQPGRAGGVRLAPLGGGGGAALGPLDLVAEATSRMDPNMQAVMYAAKLKQRMPPPGRRAPVLPPTGGSQGSSGSNAIASPTPPSAPPSAPQTRPASAAVGVTAALPMSAMDRVKSAETAALLLRKSTRLRQEEHTQWDNVGFGPGREASIDIGTLSDPNSPLVRVRVPHLTVTKQEWARKVIAKAVSRYVLTRRMM